jgi:hypothetical protein
MSYLLTALVVTLVLSAFMFAFTAKEKLRESRKLPVKGNILRKD